ncbi:MAG: serine/threonine-protein kinase [Planctomycetota bacterium]|nr:serine/threonine protein kinase [Planctomycetota bacterium]MDW8373842.1 serine/threonine-protein kinase [Planctomycetota bacterium]
MPDAQPGQASAILASCRISGRFEPGGFVEQLEALHAMGATCRIEVEMPDGSPGIVHLCQGAVHQARWNAIVGIDALIAMAVQGAGGIRLIPAAPVDNEIGVFTPVLFDRLRAAEARHRQRPPQAELPLPTDEQDTGALLEHATVRRHRREREESVRRQHETALFPDDWIKQLVPDALAGAPAVSEPASGPGPASWTPPAVGSMLGRCYLSAEIGRGATAIVYRALHITLKIDVAVKVFIPGENGQPVVPLDEARLLARLNHPQVLRVLDCSEDPPWPHLICEFIDGFTLAELIEQGGSLDIVQALRIAQQAAQGLAYAASQGVVHCDVKPGNILIARQDGAVRIADLGLARALNQPGGAEICGTPAYISPEQVQQQPVTEKTDIYALGCTLWHALTGSPLFPDPDPVRMMARHVTETPPPLSVHLGRRCDLRLERLLKQMLAKDPGQRPGYDVLLPELAQIIARIERHSASPLEALSTSIYRTLRLAVDSVRRAIGAR